MRVEIQSSVQWKGVQKPEAPLRIAWIDPQADHCPKGFTITSWRAWQAHPRPLLIPLAGESDYLYLPLPHVESPEDARFLGLPSPVDLWRAQGGVLWTARQGYQHVFLDLEALKLPADQLEALFQGVELASYEFLAQARGIPEKPVVFEVPQVLLPLAQSAQIKGYWQNQARHWINLPANVADARTLAQAFMNHSRVQKLAVEGRIYLELWDRQRLWDQGARLICAVGDSSQVGPWMVHVSYLPDLPTSNGVALVGKGVIFDSGGLNVKSASAMRLMKKDMAGAATVMAAAFAAAEIGLPIPLEVWAPLAENAIDQKSMRPSDVYESAAGPWVEIQNTDAEGRLLLADAMTLAQKNQRCSYLIDVSTLTGAMRYTLGLQVAGLLGNHWPLLEQLWKISWKQGDYLWVLPLFEPYAKGLFQTPFADFLSATEGMGSSITAAWFLKQFVKPVTQWAHIDMYAWVDQPQGAFTQAGANGQGFNAILGFLSELSR